MPFSQTEPSRDGTRGYGCGLLSSRCSRKAWRGLGNPNAVELELVHTKIGSTAGYLGIEVDDALVISEQIDV